MNPIVLPPAMGKMCHILPERRGWVNSTKAEEDSFCLYDFKILSSFLISVLVSGWNQGNHQESSGVACMYKECFYLFYFIFILFL